MRFSIPPGLQRHACARYGLRAARIGEAKRPGPRGRRHVRDHGADLLDRPTVSNSEKQKRRKLVAELRKFAAERGLELAALFEQGPRHVADALRHFGQWMYRHDRSLGDFRATINGVTDIRRDWNRSLTSAWDVVTAWEMHEPVEHHTPLPKMVFRALFAVAVLMSDAAFAVVLTAGFVGGLRPGEATGLHRRDIVLPADVGRRDGPVYLIVQNPGKARRRGVRAQHATIDDPAVVRFLSWAVGDLPVVEPSARGVCTQVAGLHASEGGYTPASCRAGCATELYQTTADLVRVQWQLRHKDLTTLESYVQELPLAMARAALTPEQASTVGRYARAADRLLQRAVTGLEGPPLSAVPGVNVRRRRGARASSAPAPRRLRASVDLLAFTGPGDESESD